MDVRAQFLGRFAEPLSGAARRRIVIWHDADGEFEEDFDALAAAAEAGGLPAGDRPLRFLKAENGALFSAKRTLAREDMESDFAVYRRRPAGDIAGDLLADIELYAEHFQADGLSLMVQALGAADTAEVRGALAELRPFFAAKERLSAFATVMPHATDAADVRAGVLAAALGKVEPTAQAIVRAFALAAFADEEAGEPGRTFGRLERYGAGGVLARYVGAVTGYTGELANARALMEHLLLTAFAATVPESLMAGLESRYSAAHSQFCLGIVRDWAESDDGERAALVEAAERAQDELNLEMRLVKAPISAIAASDIFPMTGRVIVRDLAASLAQGSDRRAEVREVAGVRRGLAGYGEIACYFDALEAACAMQDFLRSHSEGFHKAPAAAVWEAYATDWWRMDAAYRRFCEALERCARDADPDLSDALGPLADWAEGQYVHGFVVPANECWVATAEADWERDGFVQDVPRQRRFYDEVVENELAGAKRVVVIVSDALRYEVARELAESLERGQRVECRVDAVQGTFPSMTRFGMAALLPHRTMTVDAGGGAVLVDGLSTATTEQRQAALRARRPKSVALRAEKVLSMKSAEQKELARDAEVVYIYHNTVDATGEDASTEHDVFGACERAVRDICGLVRVATNQIKAARIVVTADHGFLYTRCSVPASDKFSRGTLARDAVETGERYLVAPQGTEDDLLVKMSMEAVGGGELVGLAPRGFVRINRPGGVSHYAHGGISLQELCVPVVRVRYGGSRSKRITDAALAEVKPLDTNRRITSMVFRVRLYQPQPVGGKVAPATYDLVLVDGAGNPVSDVRRAVADRDCADEQGRVMEVLFNLRAGRAFAASEPLYLVARDRQTGNVSWREEYRADIAFAPMDDFGF